MSVLRLATRKSALALAQSRMIAAELVRRHPGLVVEEVHVVTQGDRVVDRPLAAIGGKGLFVKEVEDALREGRADLAVHSMKDLPAELAAGLHVACVPARESPYDLLVTRGGVGLDALPAGARVGTSSRRREVQLLAARPDLRIQMLRGNVDTRLRRLADGDFDAIVLAEAGVRRLGVAPAAVRLEGVLVPAIAQGALALETRVDDPATAALVAVLHDPGAALETAAERGLMLALGGSCTVPLGALARRAEGGVLALEGFYATDDGRRHARDALRGEASDLEAARALGRALAERLRVAVEG